MTTKANTGDRMTVAEVAEVFLVTEQTVINWIKAGMFPNTIKPGRRFLILRSDVTKVLEAEYGACGQ